MAAPRCRCGRVMVETPKGYVCDIRRFNLGAGAAVKHDKVSKTQGGRSIR